jgi:hypothetical protein
MNTTNELELRVTRLEERAEAVSGRSAWKYGLNLAFALVWCFGWAFGWALLAAFK